MKVATLATVILPASAFVGPSGLRIQHRQGLDLASCSRPPFDNDDFDTLRREFTSTEPSTEKAKEIVDRTFRIFQDLNRETSPSTIEKERNQEMLCKLQKWIDRSIDISDEFSRDFPERQYSTTSSNVDQNASTTDSSPTTRSTTESFEVQLDVPGVDFSDLDLRLDESLKIVTVLGQRGGRSFSRGIALEEDVDVQQISASLKNGVLTIRAPRAKAQEKTEKRIPVVVVD